MTHSAVKQRGRSNMHVTWHRGLDELCCISDTVNRGAYLRYLLTTVDKDCNQIGWVIVYSSKGCWQHIRVKVEGVHIIWWQTCFCLQSTRKFSKKKQYSFHKILYSPSRVTKVSVHAPSSRMVLLCWQAGRGSIPASGHNALRFDGNQINLDLRGMEAHVTRDGFKKGINTSFIYMCITVFFFHLQCLRFHPK